MFADLIKTIIVFLLSNYSLSFFLLGLVISLVAIARSENRIDRTVVVEKLLAWYVFFSIGIDNLYNFVMHVCFGKMSATFRTRLLRFVSKPEMLDARHPPAPKN